MLGFEQQQFGIILIVQPYNTKIREPAPPRIATTAPAYAKWISRGRRKGPSIIVAFIKEATGCRLSYHRAAAAAAAGCWVPVYSTSTASSAVAARQHHRQHHLTRNVS